MVGFIADRLSIYYCYRANPVHLATVCSDPSFPQAVLCTHWTGGERDILGYSSTHAAHMSRIVHNSISRHIFLNMKRAIHALQPPTPTINTERKLSNFSQGGGCVVCFVPWIFLFFVTCLPLIFCSFSCTSNLSNRRTANPSAQTDSTPRTNSTQTQATNPSSLPFSLFFSPPSQLHYLHHTHRFSFPHHLSCQSSTSAAFLSCVTASITPVLQKKMYYGRFLWQIPVRFLQVV